MSQRARSRSWSSGQVSDSEDERGYHRHHYYRSRSRSQSRSDSEEVELSNNSHSDNEIKDDYDAMDFLSNNIKLCPDHKPGEMTRSCQSCQDGLKFVSNEDTVAKFLVAGDELGGDVFDTKKSVGLLAHYGGRCDDIVTTMKLSPPMIEIVSQVFSKGAFKDLRVWKDLVKNYLTLPKDDHIKLSTDIKSEDFINKFRKDKSFKGVFKYHNDMVDALKNLRLAQRPVFSSIDMINSSMETVKAAAMKAGLQFPAIAPPRVAATVPRQGRTVLDILKISSSENLFPVPDLDGFIEDNGLQDNNVVMEALRNIFNVYRVKVVKGYMELYEETAKVFIDVDDKMIFYLDLYSHVDGSLRDLVRDKLASLFKADVKADLLLHSSSKNLTGKPQGLFGGDSKMRSVLSEAAKTKSMISKSVYKRKGDYRGDASYRGGRDYDRRSRSRSRGRSHSPHRRRHSGSYRGPKAKKGKGGKGGDVFDKNRGSKSHKDKK